LLIERKAFGCVSERSVRRGEQFDEILAVGGGWRRFELAQQSVWGWAGERPEFQLCARRAAAPE
jgi:hypothetical protein